MGDFPLLGDGQYQETATSGTNPALGIVPTSSSSANVKGSWTQLIASTGHDASWVFVQIVPNSGGANNYLCDIGVGAAGSEVVLIPNLMFMRGDGALNFGTSYMFPVRIPASTRVSARIQCDTGTKNAGFIVNLFGSGFMPSSPFQRVTAYGANTGSSGGTTVDPGATAEVKGSWTQLSASTTNPIKMLVAGWGYHTSQSSPTSWWATDIGYGAAGSEVVAVANLSGVRQKSTDVANFGPCSSPPIPVNIPAGSRLVARSCNHSLTASPDRLIDMIVYGVD